MQPMTTLTIRYATAADEDALERLAQLDSSTVPAAPQLIAEVDGRLVAALSTRDGHAVADPFTRSGEAVTLLRRRAAQVTTAPRGRRRLATLRLAH